MPISCHFRDCKALLSMCSSYGAALHQVPDLYLLPLPIHLMIFLWGVGSVPRTKWSDFGGSTIRWRFALPERRALLINNTIVVSPWRTEHQAVVIASVARCRVVLRCQMMLPVDILYLTVIQRLEQRHPVYVGARSSCSQCYVSCCDFPVLVSVSVLVISNVYIL